MKRPFDFRLYAITDERSHPGRSMLEVMEQALIGGADVVQLRDKTASRNELLEKARALRELTSRYGVPFIVNDHPEVALAADADGVHLGQDDMPIEQARALLGPDRIIGISTHAPDQALAAERAGADYIGAGPVFATATKPGRRPVTTAYVRQVAASVRIPFVAIGGITPANADEVLAAGATRLCAVTAVVGSGDPAAVCRTLLAKMDAHAAKTDKPDGRGTVRIRINGSEVVMRAGTVEQAAAFYGLLGRRVVAELNGVVLRREEWSTARLADGASLELVHFVGGG